MKYLIFILSMLSGCSAFAATPNMQNYRAEEDRLSVLAETPEQMMAIIESGDSVIDLNTTLGKAFYLFLFMTEENVEPVTLSRQELAELMQDFPEAYHEYQIEMVTNFPQQQDSDRNKLAEALDWGRANSNRRITNLALEGLAELDIFVYPQPVRGIELLLKNIDSFPSAYEPKQHNEVFQEQLRLLIGHGFLSLSQFKLAYEFCHQGLEWSARHYNLNDDWLYLHVEFLRCVATSSFLMQRYRQADQFASELLKVSEQHQLSYSVLYTLAELARVNTYIPGNHSKALNYAIRALNTLTAGHSSHDRYPVYFAAALSHQSMSNLNRADYYIDKLIKLSKQPELAGINQRSLLELQLNQARLMADQSRLNRLQRELTGLPEPSTPQFEIDEIVKRGSQYMLTLALKEKHALDKARRKAEQELARQQTQSQYNAIIGLLCIVIVMVAAVQILLLRLRHSKGRAARHIDNLTGLFRHSCAIDKINDLRGSADSHQQPLCVAILNLWQLRQINERHGYAEGDKVIIELARLLQAELGNNDIIGRFGGSGFIIATTNSTLLEMEHILNRVLLALQRSSVDSPCNEYLTSFTAGLITVKRLESLAKMLDRCRALANQLESDGRPGVLCQKSAAEEEHTPSPLPQSATVE